MQIVGVVGTVKNEGLGEAPMPEIYLLHKLISLSSMNFVVRSTLPLASLAAAIRSTVARVDPAQPIYGIHSMREIFSQSLIDKRIESMVITFFCSRGFADGLPRCLRLGFLFGSPTHSGNGNSHGDRRHGPAIAAAYYR